MGGICGCGRSGHSLLLDDCASGALGAAPTVWSVDTGYSCVCTVNTDYLVTVYETPVQLKSWNMRL